ncbi:MAG TPA: class I SAM-dependent methyltransferase [Thermosulfidibacter takaii]|uniref:Class I SAM-dependent methyltransferase n=1 Tax=Thermosulfidibacter takaii TaxID=412593 RepID=A0A7C0YCF0_9BACT|nr:class I SAM-dependent methyltransferase [Thermosulfidibacter takaii]
MMEDRMAKENLVLLEQVFSDYKPARFKFKLWNGEEWAPPGLEEERATVVINNPGIMAYILAFPTDLRLGEAYIYGDIDIEGDIYAVFPVEAYLRQTYHRLALNPFFWKRVLTLKKVVCDFERLQGRGKACLMGKLHTIERDRQAISYHYDLPPEFYALYLDPMMNYSCAYFRDPGENLATAQKNKLELICRKLRLKPGERVLDIGCGWGGFVIYAAKKYQVQVVGITLSEKQARYAQEWIKREGLQKLAEVRLQDYREIQEKESFDKLVSIGMFEHVGGPMLKTYFRQAWELLKPGGLFLNHGIAADWGPFRIRRWSFTEQYVFPDGQLLPISKTLTVAEKVGFEVRDVESLREHYALTLRHWVKNLEEHREEALKLVDEVTYRVWRLYMAGSSYGFATNRHSVFQALLVKNRDNGRNALPLTREDIYGGWKVLEP